MKLLVIIAFAGSVFLTSGKFVNATNDPKDYFGIISLLIIIIMVVFRSCMVRFQSLMKSKFILRGIFIVCIVQAGYGLCQFLGWMPSMNVSFDVTGSFDNPAGIAATLSMGFPIGLNLFMREKEKRIIVFFGLVLIIISIVLSGSRTGILAIFFSSVVFVFSQRSVMRGIIRQRAFIPVLILALPLFFYAGFVLYCYKEDSVKGRMLIWSVSANMIKEHPIVGHGAGAFRAKYMDYQAMYFKDYPESSHKLLADNTIHPFNEAVKIAVEFGGIGLLFVFIIVSYLARRLWILQRDKRRLVLGGMTSFFVFASFSYPLAYFPVILFLLFYLLPVVFAKEKRRINTACIMVLRVILAVVCVFFLFLIFRQMHYEIKWRRISLRALNGHTTEVLPLYEELYMTSLKCNPYFLYNYGAELNVAGRFEKSNDILAECMESYKDYDLEMIMGDNYYKSGQINKAIRKYQHASDMIPSRFLPLFHLFEIYREMDRSDLARSVAEKITGKTVKIPSGTISHIKMEADSYLNSVKN